MARETALRKPPEERDRTSGEARVRRREREMRALERRQPLRRRLLAALSEAPMSSGALAEAVSAPSEYVSRRLRELAAEGLVTSTTDPHDRRKKVYDITRHGIAQLSLHRSFGPRDPRPQPPTSEEKLAFARSAVRNAAQMRRKTNRLDDAAARLEVVLQQARALNSPELVVETTNELITTLRQNRRVDELQSRVAELERVAFGSEVAPALAMQALAHREYALGRLPESDGGKRAHARASHLVTAQTLYGELAGRVPADQAPVWREREAWCIVSDADILRERSKLEDAIYRTLEAMSLFRELDDPYGQSRCLFMVGFCLRLIGDFERAWVHLDAAHELAIAHSFERFRADSLMQLGDVRRCQGDAEEAGSLLGEAVERAEWMDLVVTQAFATSALGAVAYEREDLDEAAKALDAAQLLFERCGHREGLALNARRRATVARRQAHLKRRSQLRAVKQLVMDALNRYRDLCSPAGLTACEIELARVQLSGGGRASQAIRRLSWHMSDDDQRELIARDPWVPYVLADFAEEVAKETGHDDFRTRAQDLVARADRWRARLSEQDGSAKASRSDRRQPIVGLSWAEMGGESRRQFPPPSKQGLPAAILSLPQLS